MKNYKFIASMVATFGALLMLISLFLPYAVANEYMAKRIEKYPDELVLEDGSMTSSDLKEVSLLEFSYMFSKIYEDRDDGVAYMVIGIISVAFSAMCVILALFKKPIGAFVFSMLSYGVFYLWYNDLSVSRGVVPGSNYDVGFGYYIYYFALAVTMAGCVWLLVEKIKEKIARKKAAIPQEN